MSDSQQYEKETISSDGVTVDKRFEEDEFPVPAIAFEIRSSRTESVSITLVDRVPQDVAVEDLGFHPEYGGEYWTMDEDEISFERNIESDSEYTTVYGIRATGTDNVEQFLTKPVIEEVDPPLDEADVVDEEGSDIVRDVISGDSDAIPGLDEEDGGEDEDDVGTLNLKDPNAPDDRTGESADGAREVSLEDAETDSLVGALAAEIRNGNVNTDDVKLLRKAFDATGGGGGGSGSMDARIKRLQTEVSDLLAYTDALEEFLDENGTGGELIEEFRGSVESFETELEAIRDRTTDHDETLSEVQSTMGEVESSMEAIESEMEEVLGEVEDVREDVDDVDSSVEDVESQLDDLESQIGDIDVEKVKADIEEIETKIEDLDDWRDQLSSVIGGS